MTIKSVLTERPEAPRWDVTRSLVSQLPAAIDEILSHVEEDIELLLAKGELATQSEPDRVDIRVTLEHLVLLCGRLLPFVNSLLADLYITDMDEFGEEEAGAEIEAFGRGSLKAVLDQLQRVRGDHGTTGHARIIFLLDTTLSIAALNVQCTGLLIDVLRRSLSRDE